MTLRLAPINHRWQLADLLNERKMLDSVVEVGTHRGEFARDFRHVWSGEVLWCVDPWYNPPEYEEQAKTLDGGGVDREEDYRIARAHLNPWIKSNQVQLIKKLSVDASRDFKDESCDLVYLDADHSLAGVWRDLLAWWPKVKRGGLLAGHDFLCPGEVSGGWGQFIQEAVLGFAKGLDVWLIIENAPETAGLPWSFYLEKP